jgi:DNA (cytosine-5)-methyltransferase 1
MRELSLFSGAGGGLLGTKLLGFRHIGYVEYNEYCQKVIAQRIKDGILDEAPIFGDIRAFISEGYAASYTGLVDVITAGFPCQPFSVAGKREGENDNRNMWPATIDVIRTIRPRFALLENVPGLLAHEYARTIFRDLAESGFDAQWGVLGADDIGGPHRRKRIFIMAYSNYENEQSLQFNAKEQRGLANSDEPRLERRERWAKRRFLKINKLSPQPLWWRDWPHNVSGPYLRGANDGMANWMDRLKALGNGQVPAVVRAAWRILSEQ